MKRKTDIHNRETERKTGKENTASSFSTDTFCSSSKLAISSVSNTPKHGLGFSLNNSMYFSGEAEHLVNFGKHFIADFLQSVTVKDCENRSIFDVVMSKTR